MSEKVTVKVERSVLHLPAIALRGLVVFPNNLLHFEVGREKSIAAVEWAVSNNSDVFLVAQKEMKVEDPKAADLYTYGVVAEVKQVMRVSDDLVRILTEPKNSMAKQYKALMDYDGVELEFAPGALEAVADKAIEMKIGARGLRSVMEGVMTDVMYTVPSDSTVSKVVITADCVKNGTAPEIIHAAH